MFRITIENSEFIPVTRGLSPTSRVRVAGIVYTTCEQKEEITGVSRMPNIGDVQRRLGSKER